MKQITSIFLVVVFAGLCAMAQYPYPTINSNGTLRQPTNFFATNIVLLKGALSYDISINSGVPNGTGADIHWSRLFGVPAGFADNTDDGGGGGGYISAVSSDFQVSGSVLSITNTTGTGQILRASSLAPYATLDSPQFTGTVGFEFLQADTVQVPWASRYATVNESSNLVGTLDGGSWTNLNGTEIRSGTVADARVDAAIARLSSPTFTGDPKVPTASPGDNDTSAASTAFVTAAVTAGGGGGDVTQSGNNTFTGTNTFSGTTTFNDLAIVTITVVSNLIVPNNAYGAGWNGSTDVPNENSVYDEMELRAPKVSPALTGTPTVNGTNFMSRIEDHLTEAEASALYQRTNAVLTATVAGTAVSVAQTNAVSFGAPVLYVGTTNVAEALASVGGSGADVQVFTNSGTWTKPSGKTAVYVLCIGAGGGGGSGRRGAATTIRGGGGGGASGAASEFWFAASDLGGTETVTVGVGGGGGAAITANDSNGIAGTNATASTFGNWLHAGGGWGGGGGTAAGATGGNGSGGSADGRYVGSAGIGSSGTGAAGSTGNNTINNITGAGGASGGGITAGDAESSGGAGGPGPRMWRGSGAITGGTAGTAGNPGGAGGSGGTGMNLGGGGGGGGGSKRTANAGAGGAGGLYGSGGGGGGASENGFNSGIGGVGANGIVVVISY